MDFLESASLMVGVSADGLRTVKSEMFKVPPGRMLRGILRAGRGVFEGEVWDSDGSRNVRSLLLPLTISRLTPNVLYFLARKPPTDFRELPHSGNQFVVDVE
ncbi:hypothetical protein CYMTET_41585 [Cymbomonas tetramitiformis]|uniref:Uncharacterized protein n=1 Tax=Cymbomonas tetramitiformis TaxID=36881 RepID=A0AAE0C753_9CHLO|nr:hypothetical protein CYMTET_41587 [Cymbomonas tetramitiformis]KAK3248973.1 hypothetical protein CYMTET_41585 [Cymbomonas tetramitiformis]